MMIGSGGRRGITGSRVLYPEGGRKREEKREGK